MTLHDDALLRLLQEQDKRRARDNFLAFYMRMTGFEPQPHHKLICKLLQSLEMNKVDRVMVFTPRRMAKSLLCTQLFPAWIIGRHPDEKIMSAVHTQKYAAKTGKLVRNYLRSPLYPFDVDLADDSQAKDQWATSEGGEYNGFGLMGGSTHGNPASFLFCDDLIKGRKMAMSPYMRDEAWETYLADLVSSLQGRKKQLIVTTRWHEDDIAGRILPQDFDGRTGWYRDRNTGEPWYVLCLAAIAERDDDPLGRKIGEPLWPDEFAAKFENARKRGGFVWSALFQQRPSPEEGLMFSKDHIQHFDYGSLDLSRLAKYGSSDYAITAEAGSNDPDWTVHLVWGVDEDFNIYLLDGWRERTESDKWVEALVRLVRRWKPSRWVEEKGQIMGSVGPFLRQILDRERLYIDRQQLTSSVSKEARAQALLGLGAMGKLMIPSRATAPKHLLPLIDAFEKELLQFPGGTHDDTVDAATLFARFIDRILEGRPAAAQPSPHGETLDDLFSRHEDQNRDR